MTLRQRLLRLVYPLFRFYSSMGSRGKVLVNETGAMPTVSFYSLSAVANSSAPFSFEQLRGKKVLIVNTASDCGYTAQYADLEKLSKRYKDKLVVIAFPSNQFNQQEKGDDNAIAGFCSMYYGVSFPIMQKSIVTRVNGQNEVFDWLTNADKNGWNSQVPQWNFSKYLIDEQGNLTHYLGPAVSPLSQIIYTNI